MKKNADSKNSEQSSGDGLPTIRFILLGIEKGGQESYPVYARVLFQRKKSELSLKFRAKPGEWDFETELFYPVKQFHIYSNNRLLKTKQQIIDIFHEIKRSHQTPSVSAIRKMFRGDKSERPDSLLIDFFDQQVEEKKKRPAEYTSGAIKQYNRTRTHLVNYLKEKGWQNIRLNELSRNFIVGFENYLLSTKLIKIGRPMNRSSANTCIKRLTTVINDAIRKELLDKSPFAGFKLKHEKPTQIIYLTQEEINAIEALDFTNQASLERVPALFLFAVYSGLRFSDIMALRTDSIKKDLAGTTWLYIEQKKTRQLLEVPLLDNALDIINRYQSDYKHTGRLLPKISNQKMNLYLKVVAAQAGITKKLTAHVGRHSFATMALTRLDLKTVSKMLGHSSIKSTEIYAKITKRKLTEAVRQLNEEVSSMPQPELN